MRRKEILKILLSVLVAIFIMVGAAALLLAGFRRSAEEEQKKQAALSALENVPTVAPTAAASVAPSPSPTPRPTATPTPIPTVVAAFNPDDFWDYWYSTDGTASINIWDISLDSVSFSFYQTNRNQTEAVSADVTAEVAGNAAGFTFSDSAGNTASGNLTFDNGQLYLHISTNEPISSVYPNVNCIMSREQVQLVPDPTATPTPAAEQESPQQTDTQTGEYFFPDSNSRYLTDEDLAPYSYDQLELAKNEIYARHGRQFVTQRIADYFNSKSWYQGTIDPETFDAQQDSIFNEYEIANIQKIDERMAQMG
ncbi:MAG TPA: YARHG domain-containing protein [Candidatus Blautia excrementipullorum]|nr:YARHG domain-containing protein [Candidatus Blautia excrementipullorum]